MGMNRGVNRSYIDRFIEENAPNGLLELAKKSDVSASTISVARVGRVPKRKRTRLKLSNALGVKEDKLFPLL